MALGLLSLLLSLSACAHGFDNFGELTPITGTSVVYYNLSRSDYYLYEFHREHYSYIGAVRVDLGSREVSLLPGVRVGEIRRHDWRGRRFTVLDGGVKALRVIEPDGSDRWMGPEGFLGRYNLCLAVEDGVTWAFFVASPDWHYPPYSVVRVNTETGAFDVMPAPEGYRRPLGGYGHLSAQNSHVVFLFEEAEPYRTHRGDFQTKEWAPPIEGSFEVIDSAGTLLERRCDSWLAGTRTDEDTRITVIRDGVRETVDLGLGGWARPAFGTGYVRLFDDGQVVFRSLEGGPDLRVPPRPAAHDGPAEIH